MSKNEIIEKLKKCREVGITYKFIAGRANLAPQQIYDYIRYNKTYEDVHEALEKFFGGEGRIWV